MGANLFELRPATEADMELLNYYAFMEGMDRMPSTEGITVAVDAQGAPVGFVRVLQSPREPGVAYVNPIVTYEPWRGHGVGRALMERAFIGSRELRLVARGSSVPFYRALGFIDVPWDAIEPEVNENCDGCPMREECHPHPMGLCRSDA